MSDKKLGLETAFPLDGVHAADAIRANNTGVSKRLWIAAQIAQGILANQVGDYGVIGGSSLEYTEALVAQAYQITDELLKQENE